MTTHNFKSLQLTETMLKAVSKLGYETPTAVQAQAIPYVLQGRDIIAAAKTGTGKTAAFALPCMQNIARARNKNKAPLMLVVTPTRELAEQISNVCKTIASVSEVSVLSVVGGVSYNPQIAALKRGIDVLIATPGRLFDLMQQRAVNLGSIKMLVLDEADRMLDMGFWPQIKKIVASTPKARQTLLFSATIDEQVKTTSKQILNNPAQIEIAHKGDVADTLKQYKIDVPHEIKPALLNAVLKQYGSKRVIVFARTKSRADTTCKRVKRAGFKAAVIHSNRTQAQRRRALESFANGKVGILVATDVLARGIDVSEVSYVVNFDLPDQAQDYIHRVGRAGRAGKRGFAISFVSQRQKQELKQIERLIKQELPSLKIKEFNAEEKLAKVKQQQQRKAEKADVDIIQAKKEQAERKRKKARKKNKLAPQTKLANKPKKRHSKNHARKNTNSKHKGNHLNKQDFRPGRARRKEMKKQRAKR